MRTVYLDTETTGLEPPEDRIVELCIIDDVHGEVLLHSLINPYPKRDWTGAARFHNIHPERVQFAPTIHQLYSAIYRIVSGARVVIYNASYDVKFLEGLFYESIIECCMEKYMDFTGAQRWVKLSHAAHNVGHTWTGAAHRALADCLATRAIWQHMEVKEQTNNRSLVPPETKPVGRVEL